MKSPQFLMSLHIDIGAESATTLSLQVVDLELGVLMNQDGKVLQDSQGKPKRVVLGEDGRTIFGNSLCPTVYLNLKSAGLKHKVFKALSHY